jgi:hypothetical protein
MNDALSSLNGLSVKVVWDINESSGRQNSPTLKFTAHHPITGAR